MTKREQIMRLAEFDNEALKAHWLNLPSQDDYESAKFENRRLLPLIKAMAERIETLEAALSRLTKIGPPSRPTTGDEWASVALKDNCAIAERVLTTKGPLEELLGETDE